VYSDAVKHLSDADWEELARRDPYFDVLSHDGVAETGETFFETGEADITALLAAIASLIGHDVPLTAALDFGCGAGRLTLPLARLATTVVGCDVAPTMLTHARRNALDAGLSNATFTGLDGLEGLQSGQFDFVCSLLVFQYIRPAAGHAIIRTLLRLLAPAGIAALHLPFGRREYDMHAVEQEIAAAGARVIGRFPMPEDRAVLVIGK
jgi:2-polyprenyl-3-methyl-5-hydroxy-6-metoxy-1,4-benzoquinol methylase